MKNIVLLAIVVWFIVEGCKPRSRHDTETPYNGIVTRTIRSRAYPGADLRSETEYRNGRIVRTEIFFPNGRTMNKNFAVDTVRGTWATESYYESGELQARGSSTGDLFMAETTWYLNGVMRSAYQRSAGKKDRIVKFYANSRMKEIGEFINNKRHGLWAEWDSLGRQTRDEHYVEGALK